MDITQKFGIKIPERLDSKQSVLVVEDQQDLRLIVCHHLNKRQFRSIIQASNGLEAMEKLRTHKDIGAILCDKDMPVLGGLELLGELREDMQLDRPPFCVAIDDISKEKIMLAVENGVDDIMVKPFTLSDIVPKLESAFKVFHNPKNPERVYELAKKCLREKNLKEAEGIYQDLAEAAPKAARPLVGLARVAALNGQPELGLGFLEEAARNNPNYVHTFSVRGELYTEMGKHREALTSLQHAISLSPLNPIRYKKAAEILLKQKNFEDVTSLLMAAIEKEVLYPELYQDLSESFFNLADYKKAIRYIKTALNSDPDNIKFLNQLAISQKEAGLTDEAMRSYNKVIKLDPSNLQALFNKVLLYEFIGNLDEAIKLLEKVNQKNPDFEKGRQKLQYLSEKKAKAAS